MTEKELMDMVEAEEKRLSVGSEEFMRRHNEFMAEADRILQENKKHRCQIGTLEKASTPAI